MKINRIFSFGALKYPAFILLFTLFLGPDLVFSGQASGATLDGVFQTAEVNLTKMQERSPQCFNEYMACLRTVRTLPETRDPNEAIKSCYLQFEPCAEKKEKEDSSQSASLRRDPSQDGKCQSYSSSRYSKQGLAYGWFQYYAKENILLPGGEVTRWVDKGCQPITCPAGSSRDPVQAVCVCGPNAENVGRPIEGSGSEAMGKLKPGTGPAKSVLSCDPSQKLQQTEKPKPVFEPEKADEQTDAASPCGFFRRAFFSLKSALTGEANDCTEGNAGDSDNEKGGETNPESCGEDQIYNKESGKCECAPGFWLDPDGVCLPHTHSFRSNLDEESGDNVEAAAEGLGRNESTVLTVKNNDGQEMTISVFRSAAGRLSYTKDGEHYYEALSHAVNPGLLRRVGRGFVAVGSGIGRILTPWNWGIWDAPHTDQEVGAYEGEDRQTKFEVSQNVLNTIRDDQKNPEQLQDYLASVGDFLSSNKKNLELVEEVLRESGAAEEVLGTLRSVGADKLTDIIKENLTTFPAQVVLKIGDRAQTEQFVQSARIYMRYRQKGRKFSELVIKPPAEMLSESGSHETMLGQFYIYTKYEEAYQKYLAKCRMSGGTDCDTFKGDF